MKKSIIFSLLLLLQFQLSYGVEAGDNVMRVAEYPLPPQNLVLFSSNGISVKLCDSCELTSLTPRQDIEYLEFDSAISLEKATELYIKKPYPLIHVSIDHKTNQVVYLRFGGHLDDQ